MPRSPPPPARPYRPQTLCYQERFGRQSTPPARLCGGGERRPGRLRLPTMNCFHCGRAVEVKERVGFRDTCTACDRPLHACLNCEFYDRSYNNQCREPQAERVVDKDRFNFCEFFAP